MVTQVVTKAKRPSCQTISCSGVAWKYSEARSVSLTSMEEAASQVTAAVGATRSQKSRNTCMSMLSVSKNQNG